MEVEEKTEEDEGEGEGEDDERGGGQVSSEDRLRVIAAGVWHNLVVAVVGMAILAAMPTLLSPLYAMTGVGEGGGGPTLLYVDGDVSPGLASSPLLQSGDRLTSLNGRAVESVSDWQSALVDVHLSPDDHPDGRCLSTSALRDTARMQHRHSQRLLAFKQNRTWEEVNAAILATAAAVKDEDASTLRPVLVWDDVTLVDRTLVRSDDDGQLSRADVAFACCVPQLAHHSALLCVNFSSASSALSVCIQPRGLIDSTTHLCADDRDCLSPTISAIPVEEEVACATPHHFDPSFRLFAIGRAAVSPLSSPLASSRRSLLFVGNSMELLLAVRCTNYVMRRWLQLLSSSSSTLFAWLVALPVLLIRLTQFIVAVSSSLFILNCLPVPFSDGQQAVALMADVVAEATPTGRAQSWTERLLRLLPARVWQEHWIRQLGHATLALFSVNVALTLVPALYTLLTW